MAESKKSLRHWMAERSLSVGELAEAASVDPKVIEAIAASRYTTSPAHRQRIADTLNIAVDEIQFGSTVEVEHMYGHGPQFGRSP
ncbi:MAG: helix-turn-helix transcriptional regulator [Pirellulales bacterium]